MEVKNRKADEEEFIVIMKVQGMRLTSKCVLQTGDSANHVHRTTKEIKTSIITVSRFHTGFVFC